MTAEQLAIGAKEQWFDVTVADFADFGGELAGNLQGGKQGGTGEQNPFPVLYPDSFPCMFPGFFLADTEDSGR